ncbi:MAG: hypothetical protein R3F54_13120 [Alphaproteobacteria bacterium]
MSGQPGSVGAASAIACLCVLAACASPSVETADLACPPTQIAVPSDRIGNNDSKGELRYAATMTDLVSTCRREDEDIEVDIEFTVSAERGPAFDDQSAKLTYFLATVDPNREIVDKQLLDVQLDFEGDRPVSALREAVTLRLPAAVEASGANYNLYLGFQFTP